MMLKKKIRDKVAGRMAEAHDKVVGRVTELRHKRAKSAPQWDELNAWCQRTTATLAEHTRKLNLILAATGSSGNVSAELEAAINKNAALASHVDRQVPDNKTKG
jgi:hypothetical protein